MKLSDKEIFESIARGKNQKKVIEYLYKEYLQTVLNIVRNKGGSVEDGKDVFQEAIVVFHSKVLDRTISHDKYSISHYLVGVSRNIWIDKVRKESTRRKHQEGITQEFYQEQDKELMVEVKEKAAIIDQVLRQMGDACYQILKKVIFWNLSMKEIADDLGYASKDSVKTLHHRCRKKLTQSFEGNGMLKSILQNQ